MKIISFSLWGTNKKYLIGAVENTLLQKIFYPDWICRFYFDNTVPQDTIKSLEDSGAELYPKPVSSGFQGLFWRFEPSFDSSIDRFIVRDCDSRLNSREAQAVLEWEESDLPFHCMRDHQGHDIPVLGAMWGAKPFFLDNIKQLYTDFYRNLSQYSIVKRDLFFYTDQLFLNRIIWPKIKDKAMVHDDLKRFGTGLPFKISLPKGQFIGQQWDENNQPLRIPI